MTLRRLAWAVGLILLSAPVGAQASRPDPIDPFVRVAADGQAVFGVLFGETERLSRGLYRVDFARDLSSCATSLTVVYEPRSWKTPPVDAYVMLEPQDAQAVYVIVSGRGRGYDSTFDLLLRCAPLAE